MAIELQIAVSGDIDFSSESEIQSWVSLTLKTISSDRQDLTVRLVSEQEIQVLNRTYRQKDYPTNVLSFPFESIPQVENNYLGDVVICLSVVKTESIQQDKSFEDHFALMVIHGTLHLCGFDHQSDAEAEKMEGIEQRILADIGKSPRCYE